jgi:hypothetical protein
LGPSQRLVRETLSKTYSTGVRRYLAGQYREFSRMKYRLNVDQLLANRIPGAFGETSSFNQRVRQL